MLRIKVNYMLVALATVAAANPLPKHGPTSVAAIEDNATCEPLVFTDESQCALATGVGPNDVEESSGLEKRANIGDGLHEFKERLNKIKENCTRPFRNVCSLNTLEPHPPRLPERRSDGNHSGRDEYSDPDMPLDQPPRLTHQHSDNNQSEQNQRSGLGIPDHRETLVFRSQLVPRTNITMDILVPGTNITMNDILVPGTNITMNDILVPGTNITMKDALVPGTNITIDQSPVTFKILLVNDPDEAKWSDKINTLFMTPEWKLSGYDVLGFPNFDSADSDVFVFSQKPSHRIIFHISAYLLKNMGLSIHRQGDIWFFHVPRLETSQPEVDGAADDDGTRDNEGASDNEGVNGQLEHFQRLNVLS